MGTKKEAYASVNLYFQDESRFGLFTRAGKSVTARGIKPVCTFQQVFKSTYLFGAFSPIDGHHLLLELPNCNTETFQLFLEELSASRPKELKVIILDNAAFHKAKRLKIPEDIVLIFQPPYSPELNAAEKIWWRMKRDFSNKIHKSLDELSEFITQACSKLNQKEVIKTTALQYAISCPIWTN